MTDYLPHFKDTDDNTWEVLSMDWCVDFGGRQCQIQCQRNNGDELYPEKTFVIYGLDGEFCQWDSEEVGEHKPVRGIFYKAIMDMFRLFDTTGGVVSV